MATEGKEETLESIVIQFPALDQLRKSSIPAPFLCEVWNVEGDTEALARLWQKAMTACATLTSSATLSSLHDMLKCFEPTDFVMVTHR